MNKNLNNNESNLILCCWPPDQRILKIILIVIDLFTL